MTYKDYDGVMLMDQSGNPVAGIPDIYLMYGPQPTFADQEWRRWTASDSDNWEELN
jgi:hypothetical protein